MTTRTSTVRTGTEFSAMSTGRHVARVMQRLRTAMGAMDEPAVEKIAEEEQADPFKVLIATMLSAQTRDPVTFDASNRLFARADTPRKMVRLRVATIEKLIYPVSFYRNKAQHVKATCRQLNERYGGQVPTTMAELVSLPGVGRKTANLVLILDQTEARFLAVRSARDAALPDSRDQYRPVCRSAARELRRY